MTLSDILSDMARAWPMDRILAHDPAVIEQGVAALAMASKRSAEMGCNKAELWVTPEEAYGFGMGALSLRSLALSMGAKEAYSKNYRDVSAKYGFNVVDAKVRRRAMYIPILYDDDTLVAVIEEALRAQRGSISERAFPLLKVVERFKGLAFDTMARYDWSVFGGAP